MTVSTIDKDIRYGTLSTYCCDEFPLRANLAYRTGSKVSPNWRLRCNSWAPSVVAAGAACLLGIILFLVVVGVGVSETSRVAAVGVLAGGGGPVALGGIAAPSEVCLLYTSPSPRD